jgi:hypothetical protein
LKNLVVGINTTLHHYKNIDATMLVFKYKKLSIPMTPLPQEFQTIVKTIPIWYVQNIIPKANIISPNPNPVLGYLGTIAYRLS